MPAKQYVRSILALRGYFTLEGHKFNLDKVTSRSTAASSGEHSIRIVMELLPIFDPLVARLTTNAAYL